MQPKRTGQSVPVLSLIVLTSLVLLVGLLAGPVSAFAQVTPGARPAIATLQPLSPNDNRLTTLPPPPGSASGSPLVAFVASNSGAATVSVVSLNVDPGKLGVFALQGTVNEGAGLQLGLVLDRAVLSSTAIWVRVPATYSATRKTLNFTATTGTIYAVFALEVAQQGNLPDSGGPDQPVTSEDDTTGLLALVIVGVYLVGVALCAFVLIRSRRSRHD